MKNNTGYDDFYKDFDSIDPSGSSSGDDHGSDDPRTSFPAENTTGYENGSAPLSDDPLPYEYYPHGQYGTIDGTLDPFASHSSYSEYNGEAEKSGSKKMEEMISGYKSIKGMGMNSEKRERSVTYERPFYAYNTMQMGERKAEVFSNLLPVPDSVAKNLNDPVTFRTVYPFSRIATGSDGVLYFLFIFILGFIITLAALSGVFSKYLTASEEHFPIAGYVPVTATVNSIKKNYVYDDDERKIRDYTVTYEYEYRGEKYVGSDIADAAAASEYGFTNYKRAINKTFTLYIDPQAPEYSKISKTPMPYPGLIEWLLPVPGVLMIIWSLIFQYQCVSGKRVIYDSIENPGKKRFKLIRGKKQAWRDVMGVSEF